jgi:pimeloyl-ACP methyl ester carboxylesterase
MKLEVISRYPKGPRHPIPLLFVHGANSGAWIWDEHFLPFLAARGYEAHAVSLRGHGASEGKDGLLVASLRDYVTDVRTAIRHLPQPPVLIGHSMGGMVVQKFLESEPVPGAVLMASVPPQGLWLSCMAMWMRNPMLYWELAQVQSFGAVLPNAEEIVRKVLFSDHMPAEKVREYHIQWQPESWRVVFDMMGWDVPRPMAAPPPMLVLGSEGDVMVPASLVRLTARAFGTEAVIFDRMAHAMMLEDDWQRVAEQLCDWLQATFAGQPAATLAAARPAANLSRKPEPSALGEVRPAGSKGAACGAA